MKKILPILLISALMLLSNCGRKGDLTLPPEAADSRRAVHAAR